MTETVQKLDQPSADTPRRSRVTQIAEVRTPDATPPPDRMAPMPTTAPSPQMPQSDAADYFVVFDAIARVLAIRFIALIGVIGAALLTWVALGDPNWYKLGTLAIYCVGLVLVSLVAK